MRPFNTMVHRHRNRVETRKRFHLSKLYPEFWNCSIHFNRQERTHSGPLVDSKLTPSEPLADPKRTQIFEKRTHSGPRANLKRTRGPLLGSALVLACVWSVL